MKAPELKYIVTNTTKLIDLLKGVLLALHHSRYLFNLTLMKKLKFNLFLGSLSLDPLSVDNVRSKQPDL